MRYGVIVVGVGRSEDKMRSLKAELKENASRFSYRLFDVSDENEWKAFASDLRSQGVTPVLLINNAGAFPTFTRALSTPTQTTETILRNNFFSAVYAVNAITPIMTGIDKKKTYIVNICSSASLCTIAGTSAYTASKCAMKGYTEALALDENTQNSALDKIAVSPQKMAKKIARKIYKRKRRAVVGWDAKLMNFRAKIMPVKGPLLIRFIMKKSRSKVFKNVFDNEK